MRRLLALAILVGALFMFRQHIPFAQLWNTYSPIGTDQLPWIGDVVDTWASSDSDDRQAWCALVADFPTWAAYRASELYDPATVEGLSEADAEAYFNQLTGFLADRC